MIADAGHHGYLIEDLGCAEEEMIPVRAFVAAVNEVAGEKDEIDCGMTAMSDSE